MLRNLLKKTLLKKKLRKTTLYKIVNFYKTYVLKFRKLKNLNLNSFKSNFYLTLPKRQQHFVIMTLKTRKYITLSTGVLLKKLLNNAKFFKRIHTNISAITMQLKLNYPSLLNKIFLFYIKNFNYRQSIFFYKFIDIVNPQIYFFVHKQSFIPRFTPVRRIKRRVLKSLKKQ